MEFLRKLFATKSTKSRGSRAVEEAINGIENIIDDLSKALTETDDERIEAENLVEIAIQEKNNIEKVLDKGTNFLNGLRALLQD